MSNTENRPIQEFSVRFSESLVGLGLIDDKGVYLEGATKTGDGSVAVPAEKPNVELVAEEK